MEKFSLAQLQMYPPPAWLRLPLWRKVAFGLGGYGIGVIRSVMGLFQMAFLLEVVQLSALEAGCILFAEQVLDSMFDLLIGFMSDNFPTQYGRRKPWIYVMCVPAAVFWVLSWMAPGGLLRNDASKILYYLAIYSIFSLCLSSVTVPYQAIIPDIAPTPKERSLIVVIMQFFTVIGATVASFIWTTSLLLGEVPMDNSYDAGMPDNYRRGYAISSGITAISFLVTILIGSSCVMERRGAEKKETLVEKLKKSAQVLRFLPFTILALMHCFSMISITLFLSNIYLFCKYVLLLEEQTNWLMLSLQLSLAFSLFVWLFFSWRIPKNYLFSIGTSLAFFVLLLFFFITPESPLYAVYILFLARGCTASASYFFPWTMLPDVIEYYYIRFDDRREATFYSVATFLEKLGIACCFLFSTIVLAETGYLNPQEQYISNVLQPKSALTALQCLVSVCPAALSAVSILLSALYNVHVSRNPKYKPRSYSSELEYSDLDSS